MATCWSASHDASQGTVDLAQRLDGGLGDVRVLACPAQLHELRHGSSAGGAQRIELHGGLHHSRMLLRLEVHHEAVEDLLARARERGLGTVDLAQRLDGGLGGVRPLTRPAQLHEPSA